VAPSAVPPLFDRLRVDLHDLDPRSSCRPCTREFDLFEEDLRAGASFSIQAATPRNDFRVRLRLYRSSAPLGEDAVRTSWAIDTWTAFPGPLPAEGQVEASLFLGTDSVGAPLGTADEPLPLQFGPPAASRVGSWPGAVRASCPGSPRPGEVCVPGGAFWMGNDRYLSPSTTRAGRARLVSLSPFFMDDREVTVAGYRASGGAAEVDVATGVYLGPALADYCAFTPGADPERDPMPVNCVTFEGARAYCRKRGSDLPSEAQFEYAASKLGAEVFVWGRELPQCPDAVWSLVNEYLLVRFPVDRWQCRLALGDAFDQVLGRRLLDGPLPVIEADGSGQVFFRARDRLDLPGGTIWDLGGNLSEWTRDLFCTEDEPCWLREDTNLFFDPVCEQASATVPHSGSPPRAIRGGSWVETAANLRAARRAYADPRARLPQLGFRCVRPATAR
jgi:formylglycine-generating enzyme required for sulfatase activity